MLSWFGIHGSVLKRFKSYLSSRSFRVTCNDSCSSCLCGVPQGSVLGALLFITYTTPLSIPLFHLSLNHHLYADDTQLSFSFYPQDLHLSIACLQNALHQISSWMTANLLTLNSSKSEFLFIGHKQQLAKLLGTCEASRFDSNSNRTSRFDSKVTGPFENFESPRLPHLPSYKNTIHCSTTNFNRFGIATGIYIEFNLINSCRPTCS